jgi:hypothetical protein
MNMTVKWTTNVNVRFITSIPLFLDLICCRELFLNKICQPQDRLNRLLPPERVSENISKLRHADKLPGILCRTDRFFYSFILLVFYRDGVYTNRFPIQNGVKQGGILSPVLFCIYIDGLLDKLGN